MARTLKPRKTTLLAQELLMKYHISKIRRKKVCFGKIKFEKFVRYPGEVV